MVSVRKREEKRNIFRKKSLTSALRKNKKKNPHQCSAVIGRGKREEGRRGETSLTSSVASNGPGEAGNKNP